MESNILQNGNMEWRGRYGAKGSGKSQSGYDQSTLYTL